uniref:DPBB_1 domain-containing protein n=1 Tax=Steinernema glaseri TaxID=37863 RepID=A0A1I7ZH91_9BILA
MLRLLALLAVLGALVHGSGFQLGKSISGHFTYYDDKGYGACGSSINAESQQLVAASYQYWTSSNPNNDPVCKNICVEVKYKGKSIKVPVKDKCPSCAANHFDLSKAAFKKLEPNLGVGDAKGATFKFVKC